MLRHLVNHAIQNVWCSPRQDNLHILQLHRLTAKYGVLGAVKVLGRDISLPNTNKRFHVYQIGQLSPAFLGMLTVKPVWASERWISFSYAINQTNVQVDVYSEKGVMFPRFKSHYMLTKDRNLIVAIEINSKVNADLDSESAFVRFYKNAFLSTITGSMPEEKLFHYGEIPLSSDRIVYITNLYRQYKAMDGYVTCYVNGHVVDTIDPYHLKVGDVAEFLYDSSIYKVVTFSISDLRVFTSELDNCLKYIIHHQSLNDEYINYHDDIDIDIIYKKNTARFKGLYYHKNLLLSHRMITHRDYALPVDHVKRSMDYLKDLDESAPSTLDEYKIRVKIKEPSVKRPLVFDHNRIFELYKLPDENILDAMTGIDSTVPNWKASTLENSFYTKIMGLPFDSITIEDVQNAYGYNGATIVLADSPIKSEIKSGFVDVELPLAYRINSEVYQYDSNGHYLGHSYVEANDNFISTNKNIALIEPIVGKALSHNNDVYGSDNIEIPKYDYRVYMTYKVNGVVDNSKWRDVTGTEHYRVVDGKIVWNNLEIDQWLCVRSDTTFYARDYQIEETAGILRLKLVEDINGQEVDMAIPRGEIDVIINKKSSIANLDYIVDFPYIYINNVSYLERPITGQTQFIHVRMTGFCESDLKLIPIDDFGFVTHAALSDNHRYNIRDDKVLRITLDGSVITKDSVEYGEFSVDRNIINSLNGKPYQIRDYVIPIRDLVSVDTYEYRDRSLKVDKLVEDYLTLHRPEADKGEISAIVGRYRVNSPFLSRVIYKLISDQISDDDISKMNSDAAIIRVIEEDLYLLEADPIRDENRLSDDNVIVVPHRFNSFVSISVLKYRFLNRVVQLFAQAKIELSQFILVNKEL